MNDTGCPVLLKPRRWPVALLVAFLTAIISGAIALPVAIWAMDALHVSSFEGSSAFGVVFIWTPLAIIVGFIVGFVSSFFVAQTGMVGFFQRQGIALLIDIVLIGIAACIVYANADHPPRIGRKRIEVQFELRIPTRGRSIEQVESPTENPFAIRFMAGDSFTSYSLARWEVAQRTEEYITLPIRGELSSQNSRRVLTAGMWGEGAQVFMIPLPASPRKIDDVWSEWMPAEKRDNDASLAPEDRYWLRYRVQYAQ